MFHWIQWQKYLFTVKELEPSTSRVQDRGATTAPAGHMWETGSVNLAQLMLQWFTRILEFSEFTEDNEISAPCYKNSIDRLSEMIV